MEEEEINKEGDEDEEEGEEEDEEEEEDEARAPEAPADRAPINKRKNFRPRSIVANEADPPEEEDRSPVAAAPPTKNRRKRSKTPLRVLKTTEVMDLSLKEVREESDSDETGSDSAKQTADLKKYRHIKSKCHFEKPQNLLSLLNNEQNRFNNPFGIDLSKFNKNVAQNSPVDYIDDSDNNKNINNATCAKHSECETGHGNEASAPNQVTAQPGEASVMKEYAESTMRELLSIYGLTSNEMSEPITKNVHISNFSTGKCYPE
ncbi:UNVERIFIED_CONTAM: hypothetical protein PYX00_004304 [Menopon gallinae]|uniref:Uncharacterized protein n=1 Tax=Menopon gallinae TaxID=328185 RepID=A0AAW2I3A6_9NEOP